MTFAGGMKRLGVSLLFCVCLAGAAFAEMLEVAPGVKVTKKTFTGKFYEQPFFGFAEDIDEMRKGNDDFVKRSIALFGSREKAFEMAMRVGWKVYDEGNREQACAHFNQAWLIDPTQSGVYQAFAVLADRHFNDKDFAEELFKIAKQQPNPKPSLNTEYGRFLIVKERPREAQLLLEQAVIDTPKSAVAWIGLGAARFFNGDRQGACAAIRKIKTLGKLDKSAQPAFDNLAGRVKCNEIASTASPEMAEVAPGVKVTRRTFFNVPSNEQPFYGFVTFTPQQRKANEDFVKGALEASGGDRRKAVGTVGNRAWSLVFEGKFDEAARRFNQMYLLDPKQSAVYHGLAVVTHGRFGDSQYAEELFRVAQKQVDPAPALNADFGRFMMMTGRPKDALPLLEQAVIDVPRFGSAWSNLGFARFQTGDKEGACDAWRKAKELPKSPNLEADLALVEKHAQCSEAQ